MAVRGRTARATHPVTSIALECDGEPTQDNIFVRKEKPRDGVCWFIARGALKVSAKRSSMRRGRTLVRSLLGVATAMFLAQVCFAKTRAGTQKQSQMQRPRRSQRVQTPEI
jgi:hypothetical protein